MAIKEIKREWSPCQLDYVKTFLLHSEKELKDLPKCCIGSKAIVSETDNEYFCTESGWKLGSELGGGGEIVILPETELTHVEAAGGYIGNIQSLPEEGKTYVVTYNGTAYDCACWMWEVDPGDFAPAFGNSSLVGVEGGNADAPFLIMLAEDEAGVLQCLFTPTDDTTPESVTLSIVEKAETSSAGGGGLFVVNLVKGEQMEESPIPQYPTAFAVEIDKTFAEVLAAFKAGNRVECRETAEDGSVTIYQPVGFGEISCGFSLRMLALDFVVMIMPDETAFMMIND